MGALAALMHDAEVQTEPLTTLRPGTAAAATATQTERSAFRRESHAQTFPLRDAAVQCPRDAWCSAGAGAATASLRTVLRTRTSLEEAAGAVSDALAISVEGPVESGAPGSAAAPPTSDQHEHEEERGGQIPPQSFLELSATPTSRGSLSPLSDR